MPASCWIFAAKIQELGFSSRHLGVLAAEEGQIREKQQTKIFFTLAFIDRHMHTFGGFVLKQEVSLVNIDHLYSGGFSLNAAQLHACLSEAACSEKG